MGPYYNPFQSYYYCFNNKFSGTTIIYSERIIKTRKEKRFLRSKKLKRIYGREPKEANPEQMECDIG